MTDAIQDRSRPTPTDLVVLKPTKNADSQVQDAVVTINRIYVQKGLEAACAIGEYVLETFFAGDLAIFHARGRKSVSFRRLASREDLIPSATWLYHSVAILEQLRQLPGNIGRSLSLSHHRLLLPVESTVVKRDLARKAVDRKLTVKEFNSEVARARKQEPKRSAGGRPRLPIFVKAARRTHKALNDLYNAPFPREHLSTMDERERSAFVDECRQGLEMHQTICDRIDYLVMDMEENDT